jgi:hypothetical protein
VSISRYGHPSPIRFDARCEPCGDVARPHRYVEVKAVPGGPLSLFTCDGCATSTAMQAIPIMPEGSDDASA